MKNCRNKHVREKIRYSWTIVVVVVVNNMSDDWISLNVQQNFNGRNEQIQIFNKSNYKVGRNLFVNRFQSINNKIVFSWFIDSFESFKMKCKNLGL